MVKDDCGNKSNLDVVKCLQAYSKALEVCESIARQYGWTYLRAKISGNWHP